MKKKYGQLIQPLSILFLLANTLLIVFRPQLEAKKIDVDVAIIANILLMVISLLNIYFQIKNLKNPNPQAVIRGVMAGTFIKLMVVAAAVITYLVVAGKNRSANAVFIGMGLYVFYTWLEVKISLRLNQK